MRARSAAAQLASLTLFVGSAQAFSTDYFYKICHAVVVTNQALAICSPSANAPNDCLCRSEDYFESIYSCITDAAHLGDCHSATKQSWNALEVACRNATGTDDVPKLRSLGEKLQADPIKQTWAQANHPGGKGAFLTPSSMLSQDTIKAGISYHFNIYAANVYGLGTVCYVFGIILVQIFINLLSFLVPRSAVTVSNWKISRLIRRYISLPATFGTRRATSYKLLNKWDLCFPPRMHVLLMIGYVVLEAVLMSIKYDFVTSKYLNTTHVEAVTKFVGYRAGFFAVYKMPLLVLFAGRNNLLIWLTGWQFDIFNHWHRLLGRVFLLDLVIHGACYTRWGQWAGVLLVRWKTFPPWIAAQAATIAAGFMVLLASKTIRAYAYEFFVIMHVILAIAVFVGTFIHISYFGLALEPFYAAVLCWGVDRIARVARVLWSGAFKSRAIVRSRGDILDITIKYSKRWTPGAGSYVFIHFLMPAHFFQSHPFTVVPSHRSEAPGTIKLYMKVREGMTARILERVHYKGGKLEIPIWLDGPYGVAFNSKPYREVVLIAGGIGFTGVYSHVVAMLEEGRSQTFFVHWLVTSTSFLTIFRKELAILASFGRAVVQVHVTRVPRGQITTVETHGKSEYGKSLTSMEDLMEKRAVTLKADYTLDERSIDSFSTPGFDEPAHTTQFGRPDLPKIVQGHIRDSIGPICFFVCGPAPMSDSVRETVATSLGLTSNYVQFYEECFSM